MTSSVLRLSPQRWHSYIAAELVLTVREAEWDGVHPVFQHLGVQGCDVEWLHCVGQAARQHGVHVDPSVGEERERERGDGYGIGDR